MLKPSLQLKLGQQLTMTPQLQQAIRLLQLPTIELQAHIRELLESNVMLEQDEDTESGTYESLSSAETAPETAARIEEPPVEVVDDGWSDQSVGPAENPWSSGGTGDEDRQQEFADATGQSLREHLLWQLELARLNARDLAIGRAVVDAINDDGYLSEPLDVIGASLKPDLDPSVAEVERVLAIVQMFDPAGRRRTLGQRMPAAAARSARAGHTRSRLRQGDRQESPRAAGRTRTDRAAARAARLG